MANRFLEAKVTKKVKFMHDETEIKKLTVAQVMEIQARVNESSDPSPDENMKLLNTVIRFGAPELADLADDDMNKLPMEELSKLSTEIMKFSGMASSQGKEGK